MLAIPLPEPLAGCTAPLARPERSGGRQAARPDEALSLVIKTAETLDPQTVAVAAACGLTLAEPIAADRDYPPFPRSMMDGFAVRMADAGRTLPIAGLLPAGAVWEGELPAGRCLEILTGAPCPPGAEAVVAKEDVARHGDQVALPAEIRRDQNIAPQGSECRAGQVVMSPGDLLTPMAVGVLASFSRATVRVIPRPSLGIITTGGELAAAEGPLRAGQIRDSNGPMLAAMARVQGIEPRQTTHAADRAGSDRSGLAGRSQLGHRGPDRRRFGGHVRPRAAGPCRVRGRNHLSRREAEAGQAAAFRPQESAVALRPARQPVGLSPGISSLHFGRHCAS